MVADARGVVRDEQVARVAALPDVEDRFAAFGELVDGDFQITLKGLRERLMERGSIDAADLELPSPRALAAFLRVEQPLPADLAAMAGQATSGLRSALGLQEAARRVCGLPSEPPASLLRDFGEHLLTEGGGEPATESPLLALLRLRALVAVGADAEALAPAVEACTEALRLKGRLFTVLVRHGALQALRLEAWTALGHAVRTALLWVYADQLTQALAPPGADVREPADQIQAFARYDMTDREALASWRGWPARLTAELDEEWLGSQVVGVLIRDGLLDRVGPQETARLMEAGGHMLPEGWFPFLSAVSPVSGPNGTWTALDPMEAVAAAGWLPEGHPLSTRDDTALATRLVEGEVDPVHPYLLPALLSCVDITRVDPGVLPRLRDFLDRTDGEAALEPEVGAVRRILSVRARVHAREDLVDPLHAILGRHAERCAAKWPLASGSEMEAGPASRALSSLIDAAYEHAANLPRGRVERTGAFAEGLRRIVDGWPQAFWVIVATLDNVVRQLDTDAACGIWPVLLGLRAQPSPCTAGPANRSPRLPRPGR